MKQKLYSHLSRNLLVLFLLGGGAISLHATNYQGEIVCPDT